VAFPSTGPHEVRVKLMNPHQGPTQTTELRVFKTTLELRGLGNAGDLLKIEYHPPYIQLRCGDVKLVVEEARRRGLRVYRGKRHITITDGVFRARIYL